MFFMFHLQSYLLLYTIVHYDFLNIYIYIYIFIFSIEVIIIKNCFISLKFYKFFLRMLIIKMYIISKLFFFFTFFYKINLDSIETFFFLKKNIINHVIYNVLFARIIKYNFWAKIMIQIFLKKFFYG
jgi:hypothetical protein